uniref:Cysteine-rich peptide 2 n=1 Tax=Tityus costatus TaxID=309814 RepID=CYSPE_TITCO|nr:RecName: Full=Cysteine-rich peptide clone 2; Flags: Precursor [Tityus costatus]AAW72454.1 cysteine-rich peptide precursor [Tityus costatus]
MHFSGVVLILLSMTLVNFVFVETKVETGQYVKCKYDICAKSCQEEKGKRTGFCSNPECICSKD